MGNHLKNTHLINFLLKNVENVDSPPGKSPVALGGATFVTRA
jgi:hypothetical protein